MTRIRPFRALRYDPARVDLGKAIVPPYDVIADDERADFYERDPHNAIRLELTRDVADQSTTDYAQVRRTLDAWQREKVLVRDPSPALYGLRQAFTAPDGSRQERQGFFALLGLEDYERRVVRPHEQTLSGPKADRLKMLRAARANLSTVFVLYEDHGLTLEPLLAPAFESGALGSARDQAGTLHSLARIDDPARTKSIIDFMANRPVVIADGHHRYETALAYRDERRAAAVTAAGADAPYEWLLVYFANAFAPGSLLLPIHRLVRKGTAPTEVAWKEQLPGWESNAVPVTSADAIPDLLARHLAPLCDRHAFAADDASGTLRIFSRPRDGDELTVRIIHREVIGGVFGLDEQAVRDGAIDYPKDAARTARDVRGGRGAVALYLNPLTPEEVFRVTAEGSVLPQKSTFFQPKLPTGLVFRELDGGDTG